MDEYSENLIKVYELDLTELTNEKKSVIKTLRDIETEIVKERMFINQIREGDIKDKENDRMEEVWEQELDTQQDLLGGTR